MVKRLECLVLFILFSICVNFSVLFAQEGADNAYAKLNSLRREAAQIKYDYQQQVQKVTKASDDKLDAIKADFHKARAGGLQDKKNKLDKLSADYEDKIRPIQEEEKKLIELMAPGQGANFAKSKKDRK